MQDYDGLARPRNTYDECVEYITSELVKAAQDLPLERGTNNIARPTRGAALAARAKVLLYAASPLMNGNTDSYAQQMVDFLLLNTMNRNGLKLPLPPET